MEMNIEEIVEKLIGEIMPVGETNEDNKRFENLEATIDLTEHLITQLKDVAQYNKNRPEFSMNRAGKLADKFLSEILED